MKSNSILLGLSFLFVVSGCSKAELSEDQYFMKTFGSKSNSSMHFIAETPGKGYILGGRMSVPAFVGNTFSDGSPQDDIQATGPAVVLADQDANVKGQRIFPIDEVDLAAPVYFDQLAGKGTIIGVYPTPDGGYFAIGRFRNFLFGVEGAFERGPSSEVVAPFMLYLDANLKVTSFISLNAQESWDQFMRIGPVIKEKPGGGYLMMLGINADFGNGGAFRGFRFVELDAYGKNPVIHDVYGGQFRFGRDFDFMPNGDIVVIGQNDELSIYVFVVNGNDYTLRFNRFIIDDGVFNSWNSNLMYVYARPDSTFTCIIPRPTDRTDFVNLDKNFNVDTVFDYEPDLDNQYPRSSTMTPNGDILVLNDDNTSGGNIGCFLYRLAPDGTRKFKHGFNGPGRYVTVAEDGSILLLVDLPFNGVSVNKSTLLRLSPNGTLQ